jgi:competence/damage-inducible protein CinA-like protein
MPPIELLTIGTELLLGFTLDSNGAELGRALVGAGIPVTRRSSVGDDPEAIRDAARQALERSGAFISTGGLGPTADDITKKVIADLFGMPLEFRPELWEALVARFARFGRVPSGKNRSQAEVPVGATVLPNRLGTAPGLWLEGKPGLAILLPGVPSEMRGLLEHEVLPRLATRSQGTVIRSRTLRTTGVPESSLAERLGAIEERLAPLSLAYLPGIDGVDLRLTAWNLEPHQAEARLQAGLEELRSRAMEWVYGDGDTDLAMVVLARARAQGFTLAVAESCTGGGLGARLTAIPGSSDVFHGGIIAYDNRVKVETLGVPEPLISEHGAVSEAVAVAMAQGAAQRFGVSLAVSVTGIAGPAGGSAEKPVGLVYLGVSLDGVVASHLQVFPGDRSEIRGRACQAALFRLLKRLDDTRVQGPSGR